MCRAIKPFLTMLAHVFGQMRAPSPATRARGFTMAAKEKKAKPPKPKKEKKQKGKKGAEAEASAETDEEKPAPGDGAEGAEGADGEAPKKKLAGKTLVLFIIAPLILILGGGGAAGYFLFFNKPAGEQHADAGHGKEKKKDKKGGHAGKEGEASPITEGDGVYYYALPEMLVNITSGDGRPVYLKLKITLEAPDEEVVDAIEPQLPRVIDEYQAFLRELRVDDLAGSAGTYRLRLELLRRANLAIAPAQLNAVLIEEMLVQ
jgi:flagellar protein FliL